MRNRLVWAALLVLALALAGGGVVYAQSSDGFDLTKRSTMGADLGGKVMASESFRLVTGMGGLMETSVTSANFQLCSGYVCDSASPIPKLRLPALQK
jgi:hypothetical protein